MSGKTFVNIGGNRIKVSNIKNFGISYETEYYAKVYKINIEEYGVGFLGGLLFATFDKEIPESSYKVTDKTDTNYKMEISEDEYTKIKKGKILPIYAQVEKDNICNCYVKRDLYDGTYIILAQQKGKWEDGEYVDGNILSVATPDDVFEEKIRYLYITTYQNDNFTFYEDECDIDEKLAELDSL